MGFTVYTRNKQIWPPCVATKGIVEHLKSIGIMTLVQEKYQLDLKTIGQKLWCIECTQEIYVVAEMVAALQ